MPKAEEMAVAKREDSAPLDRARESSSLEPASMIAAIAQLAANPQVDGDKFEKLVRLQMEMEDRQEARAAEKAFNRAFAKMQPALPSVVERGKIYDKSGQNVVATFATLDDLITHVKPVLSKHGFGLSYQSSEVDGRMRVIGTLRHSGGHKETSEFISAPDTSGFKNATQAIGSARSYGRRYVTFDLLGITTRGEDDDAQSATTPAAPDGYDEWETDMASKADEGWDQLGAVWKESEKAYRDYATNYRSHVWKRLKSKALSKKKGGSE